MPLSLRDRGGYFCVLLLSLPNAYLVLKEVKSKLTVAMKFEILIGLSFFSADSLAGFREMFLFI